MTWLIPAISVDCGFKLAIALTLFNSKVAIPAGLAAGLAVANFIWLTFWVKKMR